MENIIINLSELVFDLLIRKSDLTMRMNEINIIGAEKNHKILK